jgi:hypothetical protein
MDFFSFIEEQTNWYENKADALLNVRCEMLMHILGWKTSKANIGINFLAYSCQQEIQAITSIDDKFANRESEESFNKRIELTSNIIFKPSNLREIKNKIEDVWTKNKLK